MKTWPICPIRVHRPEVGGDAEGPTDPGPPQGKGDGLGEEVREGDGLAHGCTPFGKGEQLLGESSRPLTRLFGLRETRHHSGICTYQQLDQGNIAQDDREQIVKIVGNPARQHAYGFDFRARSSSSSTSRLLGNVEATSHIAQEGTIGQETWGAHGLEPAIHAIGAPEADTAPQTGRRAATAAR